MLVNYREKRVSQLISAVFSPVGFFQKCFNIWQFMTTSTLQNALNMLVRQQEPTTKVFDMCLRKFGNRFLITPVEKVDLKLLANFCHLEPFNLWFSWLLFLWRNLEIEVLKCFWIAKVTANREGFRAATGTPLWQCGITVQVVIFC